MTITIEQWVDYVFDHQEGKEAWYWRGDAPHLDPDPTTEAKLYAETYERAGELLQPFSPAQINAGLSYLTWNGAANHVFCLFNKDVDLALRIRAIRAFVPLFRDVFAVHCTPHLSYLDKGASPLNYACDQWWELLPFFPPNLELELRKPILSVMRDTLEIDHDAVRGSALSGLGYWELCYQGEGRKLIDAFLMTSKQLSANVMDHAAATRLGLPI